MRSGLDRIAGKAESLRVQALRLECVCQEQTAGAGVLSNSS